jgi:hypothetical protein
VPALIDSHAHLTDTRLVAEAPEIVERARREGVTAVITIDMVTGRRRCSSSLTRKFEVQALPRSPRTALLSRTEKPLVSTEAPRTRTGRSDAPPLRRQRFAELEQYARDHFSVQSIEHEWSAELYDPADGLPSGYRTYAEAMAALAPPRVPLLNRSCGTTRGGSK